MKFLITRPDYEPATKYLSDWSEKVIEFARSKGRDIIDLKGDKANKVELTGRILKLDPRLVVLNGHGDDDLIMGQNNEILIKSGENENLLHSRVIYSVSCRCGKHLGPKSVGKGNGAFIGYDDDFVFTSDRRFFTRPLQDKRAEPFMEASNHVTISLLKGHTA